MKQKYCHFNEIFVIVCTRRKTTILMQVGMNILLKWWYFHFCKSMMILKITFFCYFWLLFFVNGVRSWSWSCMQMYLYLKVWANQVTPGFWEEASTTRDITFRWRQMSIKASHFSGHSNVLFAASNIKENIKARHYWPFVRGIHQWPVDSPHKGPVMLKAFPCYDVIIFCG